MIKLKEILYNKKKIIIYVIAVIAVLLVGYNFIKSLDINKRLTKYLTENKFKKEGEFYTKQLTENTLDDYYSEVEFGDDSNYQKLYFDINNKELRSISYNYQDGVEYYFVPVYSYKTNLIIYDYEINGNGKTIRLKGKYNPQTSEFSCANNGKISLTDAEKETICEVVKIDVDDFNTDAKDVIKDNEIFQKLQQK